MADQKNRNNQGSEKEEIVKHRTLHLGTVEYSLQDVSYAPGENSYLNEHSEGESENEE
ncbi:hypothetical protein GCM10008967_17670 [Bacillus carboniphilus]|uniref:DUF4025 domain-containing protein n=1 Tax=Bacillus carboniphilus TaxID=86663 RepID=A0ABN0W7G1_9BACI